MDVRTLRYFVEVVRQDLPVCGQQSFTRAAEKLFVTQPTISKMLRHLEEELECTLLIREGRKLRLTDSGQAVYQRGLTILDEFRQLEAELEDISSVKKGVLRLGIPPMVGRQISSRADRRSDPPLSPDLPRHRIKNFRAGRAVGRTGGDVRRTGSGDDGAALRFGTAADLSAAAGPSDVRGGAAHAAVA